MEETVAVIVTVTVSVRSTTVEERSIDVCVGVTVTDVCVGVTVIDVCVGVTVIDVCVGITVIDVCVGVTVTDVCVGVTVTVNVVVTVTVTVAVTVVTLMPSSGGALSLGSTERSTNKDSETLGAREGVLRDACTYEGVGNIATVNCVGGALREKAEVSTGRSESKNTEDATDDFNAALKGLTDLCKMSLMPRVAPFRS